MIKAKQRIAKFITIDPKSECWNWTGCVQSNGYARVTFQRKTMGAHRLSYMAFIGQIPKDMDVCHRCDNRKCVNPLHLFTGTRKENMQDAVSKGRQAKGLKMPQSKLSPCEIEAILVRVKSGELYKTIAKDYGVTRHSIGQVAIKNGVRRHVKFK